VTLSPTRRRALARQYGLSEDDFFRLFEYQRGACPICERRFTHNRVPNVDHDHDGMFQVCGLLCGWCNRTLLGLFHRDPAYYRRAAAFLSDPPAPRALGRVVRVPGAPPEA
jgi:hypothetical protein